MQMTIQSTIRKIEKYEWLLVSLLAGFSFLLGVIGFRQFFIQAEMSYRCSDLVYRSLQMFILEFFPDKNVPWTLEIARWLAPITLAITAIKAYFSVARERMDIVRAKFCKDHTVICGLGRTGNALARDLLQKEKQVFIVEKDPQHPEIQTMRHLGANIFIGDASNEAFLRSLAVDRARHLVALCGSDATNLAITLLGKTLSEERKNAKLQTPLNCMARVRNQERFIIASRPWNALYVNFFPHLVYLSSHQIARAG